MMATNAAPCIHATSIRNGEYIRWCQETDSPCVASFPTLNICIEELSCYEVDK